MPSCPGSTPTIGGLGGAGKGAGGETAPAHGQETDVSLRDDVARRRALVQRIASVVRLSCQLTYRGRRKTQSSPWRSCAAVTRRTRPSGPPALGAAAHDAPLKFHNLPAVRVTPAPS